MLLIGSFLSPLPPENQKMSVVRRFISIFVIASLPFATKASFAHSFHYDPSAPSFLKTPPTGTGFGVPAKNQTFLCSNFAGFNTTGISITSQSTPWVNGQNVIPSQIPYVEGKYLGTRYSILG
jgi:hypothetical protein